MDEEELYWCAGCQAYHTLKNGEWKMGLSIAEQRVRAKEAVKQANRNRRKRK